MKMQVASSPHLGCMLVILIVFSPTSSSAFIEDALDVFHVVKEVTTTVLKTWDIVQTSPIGSNINFPLMREKQRKVLTRLKEVTKQIQLTEDQNAEQVAWAMQSVNNFIEGNLQLLAKRIDITDTMNRITSRFQQMQQYVHHQEFLENLTLLAFAEWTVSPNAYSVHHLMDRLHLTMFGSDDNPRGSGSNMLEMLAQSYERSAPTQRVKPKPAADLCSSATRLYHKLLQNFLGATTN